MMNEVINTNWLNDLRSAVSLERLLLDEESRKARAGDRWYATHVPDVVVVPVSTEEVATVMKVAAVHRIPVTARGGGVGYVGGCVPESGGILLSFERMNQILELNPSDGVAVVQPGVITADLQDQAEKVGWFYPPDPASRRECSIGGNIATNAGGPRCLKYGVTRSYVLGLEVVLTDGSVIRCGGRTHKNKTGFDLVSLFSASEGMLGIITEATLRLIPRPQARMALAVCFESFPSAARAVQEILNAGHLPSALEITDSWTLAAAIRYLGAGTLPVEAKGHLIVEIDGRLTGLAEELEELEKLVQLCGAIRVDRAQTEREVEAIWALRREFSYSLKATGMTKLNEDIVIPRSRLVELVEFCHSLQQELGFPVACFGHAGDGNIHTNIMVEANADTSRKLAAARCVDQLFCWVIEHGGAITGEHGIGLAKAKWFPQAVGPEILTLHQKLKSCLDPYHILNPGKMGMP